MSAPEPSPSPLLIAEKRWSAFWATVPGDSLGTVGLYSESTVLLRDAIFAYHAGAFGAAMIACRAAIESACFTALCAVPLASGGFKLDMPLNLSGDARPVEFGEITSAVRRRGILSSNLLSQVEEVKRLGNYIAHVASRQAADLLEFAKSPPPPGKNNIRVWVTASEVMAGIECAESVFRTLFAWSRDLRAASVP
jgi:hypothetical protein